MQRFQQASDFDRNFRPTTVEQGFASASKSFQLTVRKWSGFRGRFGVRGREMQLIA